MTQAVAHFPCAHMLPHNTNTNTNTSPNPLATLKLHVSLSPPGSRPSHKFSELFNEKL